jgi:hypothetical protein|tara:strand:+ start:57 stop:878 length:822 start_codon:yes stop_codon:yes gene_type:complete
MKPLSEPFEDANLRVISLGAGVQSSVLVLMAAKGELTPMPDCAIFADTGWEPEGVYEHLDWLEKQLPFPVYKVMRSNIKDDALSMKNATGQRFASMPFYTENGGMGRRQCTSEYKLQPIRNKTRELLGLKPRQRSKDLFAETWIGISWDEIQRMKESWVPYIKHRWPLLEKRMYRHHCLEWFEERYPGRELAKSACIGCPFHDNKAWREMKNNDPKSFQEAVDFDKGIRVSSKFDEKLFLHRSCKPLDEIDFRSSEDKGQLSFLDECDGMCGM